MQFTFTNEYPLSRVDEIVSYLLGPRLWMLGADYPDFLDWAQKTQGELKKEIKRAMLAMNGREIAGVVIYQRHKRHSEALEIKNLTVRPDHRGRYIANFLLRNSEIEGVKEFKSQYILCDAKARNFPIRYFLSRNRYQIAGKTDLYSKGGGDDIVYKKYVSSFNR